MKKHLLADYAVFLHPAFDPREYAQSLLNASSNSSSSKTTSHAPDERSLEALRQLGLATTSVVAAKEAASSEVKDVVQGVNGNVDSKNNDAFTSAFAKAGSGDVSTALSKLSFAVDDLNKQLRGEINTHHSALLVQAGSVSSLEDNLRQIRGGLEEVESSVDRLRRKIASPYVSLSTSLERLARLQRASDLARRASRFVTLARRLVVQMSDLNAANTKASQQRAASNSTSALNEVSGSSNTVKDVLDRGNDSGERVLSEAALTLAELGRCVFSSAESNANIVSMRDVLMHDSPVQNHNETKAPSIRAITAIEYYIPAVEANRAKVINEMEIMIRRGLQELVWALELHKHESR